MGFTFICGGYARQVSQFGPALIFVLTFISPSKWMTRAVAKVAPGKRALTRLTQLAIPERGQSVDFAVRAPRLRGGLHPRKTRLNIARCVSMARSTASLPITTRACAIRLRATPHDGARLRSTSHRKTAAVLRAGHQMHSAPQPPPGPALMFVLIFISVPTIAAAGADTGSDVRLDFHRFSPGLRFMTQLL